MNTKFSIQKYCATLIFLLAFLACYATPSFSIDPTIPDDPAPSTEIVFENAIKSPFLERAEYLQQPNSKNHVFTFDIGSEALLARIHLIRAAQRSISIQTLIWSNDEVGRLIMYELIQAAKRGVLVRVIVDHIASEKNLEVSTFLASVHPNLQIKIYNPIGPAIFKKKINPTLLEKMFSLVTGFDKLNQRMHNKVFLIDDVIGITGGRNHENTYFDQARGLNYKDRDILVMGPVVNNMSANFEKFWDYRHAYLLQELLDVQNSQRKGDFRTWSSRLGFRLNELFTDIERRASEYDYIKQHFTDHLLEVEHVLFIADAPGKNKKKWLGRFKGAGRITLELAKLVEKAKEKIVIQTPYLVLSGPAIKLFKKLRAERPDLDIQIVTNSLAATDSWFTYAASFKQKQLYLNELGFHLYEVKPHPGDMELFMPTYTQLLNRELTPSEKEKYTLQQTAQDAFIAPMGINDSTDGNDSYIKKMEWREFKGVPYFCLHSKSMVIDDEISFIGSYNLDPRSENLNTEVGLVIHDRNFANRLQAAIAKDMEPQNSWVIAKREIPLSLDNVNAILVWFSRTMPVDPWPIRYASAFELIEGNDIVLPQHADFYNNYRSVGSFPEVADERNDKIFGALIFKTFGKYLTPLL
jgi:putative cardiolipin synthase